MILTRYLKVAAAAPERDFSEEVHPSTLLWIFLKS
jgi:hypothetical protein